MTKEECNMTQKEIDKFLANTKVYVNGKSEEIQEKLFSLGYKWPGNTEWVMHIDSPFLYLDEYKTVSFGESMGYFSSNEFREITAEEILSLELTEPAYRPFKNKEECWQEMMKHKPFGWVFSKNKEARTFVYYISINYMNVHDVYNTLNGWTFDYEEMFDKYTFADGTPFGIKEG